MPEQKKYILKIILIGLATNAALLLTIYAIYTSFFAPSEERADSRVGYIDTSLENKVKVCKDVACASSPDSDLAKEIIDFKMSGDSPLKIDSKKGLSGKAWGDELGWVTFNPPYGGIFFADAAAGLLKGTAWSENSGAINFSVTGQKVTIDPKTGQWRGWAWASGPYGGWVKFDCQSGSCVHSTWRGETAVEKNPSFAENISSLWKKAKETAIDGYDYLYAKITSFRNSVLRTK